MRLANLALSRTRRISPLAFVSMLVSCTTAAVAIYAWSSLVHAGIMAVQAFQNAGERGHLLGDVPALVIVGVALLALAPAKQPAGT